MSKEKSKNIAEKAIAPFRQKSWLELKGQIGTQTCTEILDSSGKKYQIEIEVFWDSEPDQDIRVHAALSYNFLTSFFPITGAVFIQKKIS